MKTSQCGRQPRPFYGHWDRRGHGSDWSFLPGPAGAASGGHRDHRPLRQGLCPVHSSGSAGDDRLLCDEQPAEVPGLCRLRHGGDHHRRDLKHDPGSGAHLRSPHGNFRRGGRHGHKSVRQLLHPLFQCNFRKGCIRLRIGKFTPSLKIYGEILHAGLPSLCRQGLASAAAWWL